MNYTLKQLRDRVDQLIANQGEDAHCGAWIYTKEDCHLKDCLLYTSDAADE